VPAERRDVLGAGLARASTSEVGGERHGLEVVADVDNGGLQRPDPSHLAEPRLDAIERTRQGPRWTGGPYGGGPALGLLRCVEDCSVAIDEVGEVVIVAEGLPVAGVERSGRPIGEDGIRYDLLESCY